MDRQPLNQYRIEKYPIGKNQYVIRIELWKLDREGNYFDSDQYWTVYDFPENPRIVNSKMRPVNTDGPTGRRLLRALSTPAEVRTTP